MQIERNGSMWVKLTPTGVKMYHAYYAEVRRMVVARAVDAAARQRLEVLMATPALETDGKGWTRFGFTDFLIIFGGERYEQTKGGQSPFFDPVRFTAPE